MTDDFQQTNRALFTVRQFVQAHPWCKFGGLRAQIFDAAKNGMDELGVLLRMGRKILIDRDRYFLWLDRSNSSREGVQK